MSKPTREERMELGGEAKRLSDSPLFNAVMQRVEDHFIRVLKNTTPGSEAAVKAHASLFAIPAIQGELTALVNDGEMARKGRD